jgi:peptidoglycan/xylan/chitin deacetylase (PgdA/CDA1 family)
VNAARALLSLLDAAGAFTVARAVVVRRRSFALELHGVCSRRRGLPPGVEPSFAADELASLLGWLETRFRFLDPDQFLSGAERGVLLTFDDGFANHHRVVLPLLERHSAAGLFFVTTQHVTDPKNWLPSVRAARAAALASGTAASQLDHEVEADLFDGLSISQLRALAAHPLATIGAHTLSHPRLTLLDDQAARHELAEARGMLGEITRQPIDLLAYPSGDYDRRVAQLARAAGYRAAFAEVPRGVGEPAMEIERVGLYRCHAGYWSAKTSGLFGRPFTASSERATPGSLAAVSTR